MADVDLGFWKGGFSGWSYPCFPSLPFPDAVFIALEKRDTVFDSRNIEKAQASFLSPLLTHSPHPHQPPDTSPTHPQSPPATPSRPKSRAGRDRTRFARRRSLARCPLASAWRGECRGGWDFVVLLLTWMWMIGWM